MAKKKAEMAKVTRQAATLANHLKAIMTEPAPQKVRYQRRGRIDRKLIGALASGTRNDVMQKRRMQPGQKPPRVLISVDASGSMQGAGSSVGPAMEVWMQSLERAGIPWAVGFWGNGKSTVHKNPTDEWTSHQNRNLVDEGSCLCVVKDWDEAFPKQAEGSWATIVDRMATSGTPTHGAMMASVDFVTQGADATQETIIVFFTDGAPNYGQKAHHDWIAEYIEEQHQYGIHIIPFVYDARLAYIERNPGAYTKVQVEAHKAYTMKTFGSWPNVMIVGNDLRATIGAEIGRHVKKVVKGR